MQYYDAIIIRFTDEDGGVHNIFVDGGDKKSRTICYTDKFKKELETLFGMGESIDLWVITHVDDDHIGGLYNFINDTKFFEAHHERIKEVWMNYGGKGDYEVQRAGTGPSHPGSHENMDGNGRHQVQPQVTGWQSHHICLYPMGQHDAMPKRRTPAMGQQPGGKCHPAHHAGTKELPLLR